MKHSRAMLPGDRPRRFNSAQARTVVASCTVHCDRVQQGRTPLLQEACKHLAVVCDDEGRQRQERYQMGWRMADDRPAPENLTWDDIAGRSISTSIFTGLNHTHRRKPALAFLLHVFGKAQTGVRRMKETENLHAHRSLIQRHHPRVIKRVRST